MPTINFTPKSNISFTPTSTPQPQNLAQRLWEALAQPALNFVAGPAFTGAARAGELAAYGAGKGVAALTGNKQLSQALDTAIHQPLGTIPVLGTKVGGLQQGAAGARQAAGELATGALYAAPVGRMTAGASAAAKALGAGPRVAQTVGGALTGATLGYGFDQTSQLAKGDVPTGLPGLGTAAGAVVGGAVGALTSRSIPNPEKQYEQTLDLIAPKLTNKQKSAAIASGRSTKPGILTPAKVLPARKDYLVADAVAEYVDPKAPITQNIENISQEVSRINYGVETMIAERPVPFNENQLRARLNAGADDLRLVFASDANAENTYRRVVEAFLDAVKKKDTLGLFQGRQTFDQLPAVQKLLNSQALGENTKKEIVLAVRRAANEYIASLLPTNNPYRALLLQESYMLEALKNIGDKAAATIGKNSLQIYADKYPLLKWVVGGVATALTGLAGIGVGNAILNSTE